MGGFVMNKALLMMALVLFFSILFTDSSRVVASNNLMTYDQNKIISLGIKYIAVEKYDGSGDFINWFTGQIVGDKNV